jgi:hypothetical protein
MHMMVVCHSSWGMTGQCVVNHDELTWVNSMVGSSNVKRMNDEQVKGAEVC